MKDDYEDEIIKKGNEEEKILELTIDDEPKEDYTPKELDILKKKEVKANIFIDG
ncbi:polysaccharide deacetylase family protein, partial [Clostridioides difficile]|uniref:polysaccharide deacetylase family protein n=1 Tax=Clostridioides difficile TaxID=1496 RepID=UPI0018DB0851|nr:oligosaccharide deacetylase [Clostridioides difficile]